MSASRSGGAVRTPGQLHVDRRRVPDGRWTTPGRRCWGVASDDIPIAWPAAMTVSQSSMPRTVGAPAGVLAALVGVVLLGQLLHLHEWLGIVVVVATDAAAVVPARRMTATHTGETPHRACPPRSVPRPRPDVRRPYTGARAGRRVRPGTSSVEAATTSRSRVTSGPT
jgi:hypothetical protein